MCQKIGHLARVCKAKPKRKWEIRGDTKQSKADAMKEKEEVHTLHTEAHSSGSESDHLYAILQLGNKSDKFLVSTKINGVDIEMELDSGAERSTIPWALFQEKLAGACELVDQGELRPVDKAEWATPIVVVPKSDGGIRICGDFKVTINPVICPQTFPLPTPEEMFSALANGESFTKLDLSRAYKQMISVDD